MVALSPVNIGNLALSNVGSKSSIEDMNGASTEAKRIKQWYNPSRQQVLEAYDWSFARKREAMSLDGDDPPDQWTYRYQYPADCIAIRRIWNPAGEKAPPVPFALETSNGRKTVLTDMEDAVAIYTYDVTDSGLFSMHFSMTLSYLIGAYIAMSLTGKRTIKQDCLEIYNKMIMAAPAQNANENVEPEPKDADWISGRT